ncbi:signal recognition particle-docking protein FtsY [bacterium]|jgi:fused signal recognition particle receptor|nr:signal recognition particle-docking protein FtsY [bacterium]
MFGFIKNKLKKIYNQFTSKIQGIFSSKTIDEQTLYELKKILLSADTGVKTTKTLIEHLRQEHKSGKIGDGAELKQSLENKLNNILSTDKIEKNTKVYLLVGVNGSGKTTFSAKLANKFTKDGKKVLLAAADTFRAAATEQLEQWASKTNTQIVTGGQKQDPGSVVFQACTKFREEKFDVLIIDTAGRLQTKTNLMNELEKLRKIIDKKLPEESVETFLTIDAMLGQNSFEQARLFNESTNVSGVVLTKMDGTGKGGIIFALKEEFNLTVEYISYGEQLNEFEKFEPKKYVTELLEK